MIIIIMIIFIILIIILILCSIRRLHRQCVRDFIRFLIYLNLLSLILISQFYYYDVIMARVTVAHTVCVCVCAFGRIWIVDCIVYNGSC